MARYPFFRPRTYSAGAGTIIYLLLLGHLVLDTLFLISSRNLYFAVRVTGLLPIQTAPRLGSVLLVVGLAGMFLHMAGSDRSLRDLEFPRGVLLYSGRVAGIQCCAIAAIQIALIVVVPTLIGHPGTILSACGALGAGIGLVVVTRRQKNKPGRRG